MFSSCSVKSFKRTIFSDLTYRFFNVLCFYGLFNNCYLLLFVSQLSTQGMCLINSTGNSFSQEADSYKNPGHSWSADDQCRLYYGLNASFCHVIKHRILFKYKFYI